MLVQFYCNRAENHAITVQEGEVGNEDPNSFYSSFKGFMKDWLIEDVEIEFIPNDV